MDAPPLLLTGFMGAGKTTAGRLAAQLAGAPFADLDDLVAREAGEPVASLLSACGEPALRALEAAVLRRLLAEPSPALRVIALGGGALLDPALRREALDRACVITLTASPRTLADRARGPGRPLLDGAADGEARVRDLLAARAPAYAEAHARVATDGVPPERVAERVLRAYRDRPLLVPLGPRTYGVRFADDPFASTADAVAALAPSGVFVITDEHVAPLWGAPMRQALAAAGLPPAAPVALRPGEEHKNLAAVETALTALRDAGADRSAVVIGHGGGIVNDIAGFCAATWSRGVRWVAAPTTLLAMVDASVGGKTGVDLGAAKNAIGAFHQPSAVVVGAGQLATEPDRGYRSGLAEVIKSACVGDAALLDLVEREAAGVLARDPAVLAEVIRRSVAVKARVVARDEREAGERALLNFGHTLGHALEAEGAFRRLLHGEAVALGMVAMLRVGRALGVTDPAAVERVTRALDRLGLPASLGDEPVGAALRFLTLDKKRRGGDVRAVLLRNVGDAVVRPMPLDDLGADLVRVATERS